MRYELPCEVVQDLLPSYIDGLTQESTTESLEAHLESCDTCRRIANDMMEPDQSSAEAKQTAEIDYMKKIRSRGRRSILLGAAAAVCLILALVFFRFYIKSGATSSRLIDYTVTGAVRSESEENPTFTFYGNLVDYSMGVAKVEWTENEDQLNIVVKSSLASPLHHNDFCSSYVPKGEIHRVTLNDVIVIWEEGQQISAQISQIYNKMNPYVGNHVADGELAQAVGLSDYLADYSYTTELQTTTEPYGWILNFKDEVSKEEYENLKSDLPRYSTLLLATIDNLGYMEYRMNVEGISRVIAVDEAMADELLGTSVKDYVQSASDLQELFQKVKLFSPNVFGPSMKNYVEDNFHIEVTNNCSTEIYSIGLSILVNGEAKTSEVCCNANGSPLKKAETITFDITPEEYGFMVNDDDQVTLSISIYNQTSEIIDESSVDINWTDKENSDYYQDGSYNRQFHLTESDKGQLVVK